MIDLDTGSSDVFVATTQCELCTSWVDANNNPIPLFSPSQSSSFVSTGQSISITYGSGDITGVTATDNLALTTDSISSFSQNFLTLTSTDISSFSTSGLAGLGFPALQQYPTKMLIQNLKEAAIIDNEMFMFNLHNSDYSQQSEVYPDGIIFGQSSIQQYLGDNWANLNFIDVSKLETANNPTPTLYYWTTMLTNSSIAGNTLATPSSMQAITIVDTGTSIAMLHSDI